MTSRPRIPPSSGRPRLPISMDDNFRGNRALPSPTSPTSANSDTIPSLPSTHQYQIPDFRSRGRAPYDPKTTSNVGVPRRPDLHHRHSHLATPSVRPWEERFYTRHRDSESGPANIKSGNTDSTVPSASMADPQGWTHSMGTPSFWPDHDSSFNHFPTPGTINDEPVRLPSRSLSVTDLPRNPNGSKKQQSGRRRTACDRCKRQKSSCVEAYTEDPLTGKRKNNPDEKRCHRCVEKGMRECTITTTTESYARPRTPIPAKHSHPRPSSVATLPSIPTPLPSLYENESTGSLPQHPPNHLLGPGSTEQSMREMQTAHGASSDSDEASTVQVISPNESENQSGMSAAAAFWDRLFEEDASIRVKKERERSPGSDGQVKQGRVYFGTSHMAPKFVKDFVTEKAASQGSNDVTPPKDVAEMVTVPAPTPRRKRPDHRAEKLLKHLPGNELEMDRYVDRFCNKYNCWADVIDEVDFREMYNTFKREHCFGSRADRVTADFRDLSIIFMVLAFGVVLDHVPAEEVARQNASILASVPQGEERKKVEAFLRDKDAASMTLNLREEMSSSWASLAKDSLVEAQTAGMGETINSISAWVLVAWYSIHGRRAEEGWSVLGQAARQAMASGFHIDASHRMIQSTEMPAKEQEQRRRLWAHMVIIDTSVSLYLGRPHAVFGGQQYTSQEPANIDSEQLHNTPPVNPDLIEAATERHPWELDMSVYVNRVRGQPLDIPTRSTFLILHLRLAYVIGQMQIRCFGLKQRKHEKDVVECEMMFEAWAQSLPPHFRMQDTDRSLDDNPNYHWMKHQRKNLHSKYYIARISLHRPYLLATEQRTSEEEQATDTGSQEVNPYAMSRDACYVSALADLNLRTQTEDVDPLDRFKWMTVASGFNPALVMGVLCFSPAQNHKYKGEDLLRLLSKYLEVESRTLRKGPVLEEELKVLKFLYKSAKVHAQLGGGPSTVGVMAMNNPSGSGVGGATSGARLRGIEEVGEPSEERGTKRSRANGPLTTTTPLASATHGKTWVHLHTNMDYYSGGPIPLPPPGHLEPSIFDHGTLSGTPRINYIDGSTQSQAQGQSQISTSSTASASASATSLSSLMLQGHQPGQQYFTSHQYNNIPFNLQGTIADFSSGDHNQMSFSDWGGMSTMHSQIDSYRPQSNTGYISGIPHTTYFHSHSHATNQSTIDDLILNAHHSAPHPFIHTQTHPDHVQSELSNEDCQALWAALAVQPAQPPVTQVLSRVNFAAAHVPRTTPENPSIELPPTHTDLRGRVAADMNTTMSSGFREDQLGPMISGHSQQHQQHHQSRSSDGISIEPGLGGSKTAWDAAICGSGE